MVRLEKLYKQGRQQYAMELLTGETRLANIVTWIHMIEDEAAANFLRGNELVFTTGIGHTDTAWLSGFTRGLMNHHASGLVINIGPHIASVPSEVIEYCTKCEFPLFTVPWHIRLVDITRNFCRTLISAEQKETSVSNAFKNVIFSPQEVVKYQAQLERLGFNTAWRYCAAVFDCRMDAAEWLEIVRLHLESMMSRFSDSYSIFINNSQLIIVFVNFHDNEIVTCINNLLEYCKKIKTGWSLGVGQNQANLLFLAKSYKQAESVLTFAAKRENHTAYYKDLGIYRLLLSVEDDTVLREIYQDSLGKLADYDRAQGTDYMDTLKFYLENDASVQAAAKLTYVHRNTINYKLNKIKEIINCNLACPEDKLKLMLAFKIRDLL